MQCQTVELRGVFGNSYSFGQNQAVSPYRHQESERIYFQNVEPFQHNDYKLCYFGLGQCIFLLEKTKKTRSLMTVILDVLKSRSQSRHCSTSHPSSSITIVSLLPTSSLSLRHTFYRNTEAPVSPQSPFFFFFFQQTQKGNCPCYRSKSLVKTVTYKCRANQ